MRHLTAEMGSLAQAGMLVVVGITGLLLVWKVSSGRGEADSAPAEVR